MRKTMSVNQGSGIDFVIPWVDGSAWLAEKLASAIG